MAVASARQDGLESSCAYKSRVFCVGGLVGEDFDYGST